MKYAKLILIISVLMVAFFVSGCVKPVADVKSEDMIGEKVSVRGEVSKVIKIGSLSGYTLTDKKGDSISIAAKELPEKGDTVTAKGELGKVLLIGYIIDVDK